MKTIAALVTAAILASTTPCLADWKDTIWTDLERTAPHRPAAMENTRLSDRLVKNRIDDIFTEISRTAPLRKESDEALPTWVLGD